MTSKTIFFISILLSISVLDCARPFRDNRDNIGRKTRFV